jgi:transcriptional regulator with XRE-family HTH domain
MKSNLNTDFLTETRKYISSQLIYFRDKEKLTQLQLAELMGVSPTTISKIETGKWSISLDTLATFAHYLNFTIKLEQNE